MMKLQGLVALIGVLSAATVTATPIAGTSLQTTISGLGGVVDVQADQYMLDQQWQMGATGIAAARIQFELSAFASSNTFGIYDLFNPASRLTVFSGADGAGTFGFLFNPTSGNFCTATLANIMSPTCAAFGSNQFGFFLSTPTGDTYFSQTLLNADQFDHMVAFEGGPTRGNIAGNAWLANEYLLAWEDLYGGGDRDYDDFAVMVESVIGVPEPASIAIFGLGLLAVGVVRRRRSSRAST